MHVNCLEMRGRGCVTQPGVKQKCRNIIFGSESGRILISGPIKCITFSLAEIGPGGLVDEMDVGFNLSLAFSRLVVFQ